ncbi:uncharacterized protein AC631_00427 [Debaryomyces fabryi]|uniref:Mevalonate kinase n=1 Tax=Debaryomyces fabryi TaxID=58627 RepID=A0A0V1Q5N3_9ASCO|nr:uncharacterized protein AC631_00427 [Debaryomyces fabryi]KSA03792.1 hypothetical protein AC631_00427 [Debaryomyces fabryi]CUM45310.1 unnamed protein product [Debaryomyces fabryi]
MSVSPFLVSAPGKVIIYGEHSAVYGKPAIAAALSLRAYLLVTPSEDLNVIRLDFPDIELTHSWNKDEIPWEDIRKYITFEDEKPVITEELVPEIIDSLSTVLGNVDSKLHYTACLCFLYLYTNLCNKDIPGMRFIVKSTLPIGAGLGSSACTAVCLASALARLGKHVSAACHTAAEKVTKKENSDLDFIDSWSLMGEKCFHGNPSGIDNAVATYGGAVMFQRTTLPSQPSVRTTMRNFPPIKLLLTNTKVPRSTAALVGNVAQVNRAYPKCAGSILDAMEHLVLEAYQIMIRPTFGKEEKDQLRELVNINHGLLVALGVSHPALEKIKIIGDTHNIGSTKLTGAGGGGCAISLVHDDVEEEVLQKAIKEFENEGYETFETSLGGKGVGCLSLEDVSKDKRENVFSAEVFSSFKDRDEVEKALKSEIYESWRFW